MTTRWTTLLGATFLSGASLLASAGSASAAPLTTAQILSQFNAVVFGNFSTSSEVEGRLVVGGNLTANNSGNFNIKPGDAAASSLAALTVYGNVTGNGNLNINGGASIGGTNSASLNLNGDNGYAYVGGTNNGKVQAGGTGSVIVGGTNSGQVTAGSAGGSVYVGGGNTGSGTITATANGATVAVNGNNSNNNTNGINVGNNATVEINGNTGGVSFGSNGKLIYSGSKTGNQNLNGATVTNQSPLTLTAPTTPASPPSDFASNFQTQLTALSTQLAGAKANSVVSSNNGINFNAQPDSTGTAVFNVGTSLFTNNATVKINLNGATSVIINVSVDGCSSVSNCGYTFPNSVNFSNPTSYADNVVWNFVNATGSINFSSEFGGTVLAPYASITNSSPIDGTVIANSFTGNSEIHSYSYAGSLTAGLAVPEPASLLIIGTGLAGLGLIRRSRRAD